jgi:hypothetical protein
LPAHRRADRVGRVRLAIRTAPLAKSRATCDSAFEAARAPIEACASESFLRLSPPWGQSMPGGPPTLEPIGRVLASARFFASGVRLPVVRDALRGPGRSRCAATDGRRVRPCPGSRRRIPS